MAKKKSEAIVKFTADTKEYTSNLDSARNTTKNLKAELKLVEAQFKNSGNESEYYTQKQSILERQLEANQQEQEALTQKMEAAKVVYGENSTEVDKWVRAIMSSQTQAERLKGQLANLIPEVDENEQAMAEFDNAMAETDSTMSQLTAEIKLAETQYKATGDKEEYLSQKQKILEQEIEASKRKQETLTQKLNIAKKAYGENSDEARKLATQLTNTHTDVIKLQTEAKSLSDALEENVQDFEEAGESAKKASEGYTVAKGAMANLVSDGVKSLGSALSEIGTDSDAASARFAAATGTAADSMDEYNAVMQEIYKDNFGESLTDIAEKMTKVKEVTKEVDPTQLKKLTENAITLEDTFGMDMSETLRGVNSLMSHFGLSADEAFDLMASGAQQGLNYTDELGDNVSEYAGKFAEAGYTADEYFQLLKNGSEGGAYNLDKVNDAINEVTTRLGDGTIADTMTQIDEKTGEVKDGTGVWSQKTEELFAKWQTGGATQKDVVSSIVTDIQNAKSEQEKMNLAALAFGTMAEDGGTQFIQSISSVGDSFVDTKGKMDEVANTRYDDVGSSLEGLGRTLKQDIIQPIVTDAIPKVTEIIEKVSTNVPLIVQKLQEMQPIITAIAVVIGILTTAMAIQSAVTGVKTAMEAAETTTLWGLVAAQTAALAPYLLIAAAIAAVIAIIVICVKHWDTIKEKIIEVGQAIKEKMVDAWEAIKSAITGAVAKIKEIVTAYFENVKFVVTTIFNAVKTAVLTAWNAIKTGVTTAINAVKTVITTVFNAIKTATTTVWNAIKTAITTAIKTAKTTVSTVFNAIKTTVSTVWNAVKTATSTAWNAIKTAVTTPINAVKETVGAVVDKIKEKFGGTFESLKEKVSNIFTKIKESITKPIETAKETITGLVDKIKGIFEKLKIKLPKIKVPHFNISGGEAPWGIAGKGTKPTIDIEWYKSGALLKRATNFGVNSKTGKSMVGGEAGYEYIGPVDVLQDYVSQAVESANASMTVDYDALGESVAKACAKMNLTIALDRREVGRLVRGYAE